MAVNFTRAKDAPGWVSSLITEVLQTTNIRNEDKMQGDR